MRNTMHALNNDRNYASGSIIPEIEDITNQEIIDRINSRTTLSKEEVKVNTIYHTSTEDFGPQRFDKDGIALDQSPDSGEWIDINGNILVDSSAAGLMIRDDFGSLNTPNRPWDVFEEVVCSKEDRINTIPISSLDMEQFVTNGKLDIWKLKQRKLPRDVASWIWNNRDTVVSMFKVEEEDEVACNEFSEDTYEPKSDEDIDVGISFEDTTHMSPETWNIWKSIGWKIAHTPDKAIDILMKNYDLLRNDGIEVSRLIRLAYEFKHKDWRIIRAIFAAAKAGKGWSWRKAPIDPKDNGPKGIKHINYKEIDKIIGVKLTKSNKYEGQYFIDVNAMINNRKVRIAKTNKSTNWLAKEVNHDELNKLIPMLMSS